MGQEVANVLDNDKDILLLGGVDKENTGIYTYPVYTNTSNIEEKPDVIIDFSVPVATLNILKSKLLNLWTFFRVLFLCIERRKNTS